VTGTFFVSTMVSCEDTISVVAGGEAESRSDLSDAFAGSDDGKLTAQEKEFCDSLEITALSSSSCNSGGRRVYSLSEVDSSCSGRGRIVIVYRRVSFQK
jgi:hypothetical protein